MRTLLLAGAAVLASIALAVAAVLAPKDIQATFFTGQPFTAATPTWSRASGRGAASVQVFVAGS